MLTTSLPTTLPPAPQPQPYSEAAQLELVLSFTGNGSGEMSSGGQFCWVGT